MNQRDWGWDQLMEEKAKRKRTMKFNLQVKVGGGLLIGIFLIWIIGSNLGINSNPQDGDLIGQITNIKSSGVFFPANEVDIVKGGLQSGTGTLGGIHKLTYTDNQRLSLQQKMNDNREVNVHYNCPFFYNSLFSDNGCFITEIK